LLICTIGLSQIHRPRNEAIVFFKPIVSADNDSTFTYIYTVISSAQSKAVFNNFVLYLIDSALTENKTPIQGPANKKWYIDGIADEFIGGTAANRFFEIPPGDGLAPGESMTFSFNSIGLPSIKPYYAQSFTSPYTIEEYDSLLEAGYTEAQLSPARKDDSFKGVTVAPHVYYSPITPIVFLDTLLSYSSQSAQLGWLLDKNAEKRINHKLEMAKRLLEKAKNCKTGPKTDNFLDEASKAIENDESIMKSEYGGEIIGQTPQEIKEEENLNDIKQYKNEISKSLQKRKLNESQCIDLCEKVYTRLAIKTLESLVREVEILNRISEKGKKQYITSEAYALLKYNTEYLLDQLSEKSKK
jgi:hypothetical protein